MINLLASNSENKQIKLYSETPYKFSNLFSYKHLLLLLDLLYRHVLKIGHSTESISAADLLHRLAGYQHPLVGFAFTGRCV